VQRSRKLTAGSRIRIPFRPGDALLPAGILLHALALVLFTQHAKTLSYFFIVTAPLLAAVACFHRARSSASPEGWVETALAMLLWSGGMGITVLGDVFQANSSVESISAMLLFVLYGVPLIFAVASPVRELWHVRLIDCVLALVLGCLFYVHASTFAAPDAGAEGMARLRLMFDMENAFIALFALARFRASNDGSRRAFFGSLTAFAFTYLAVAFFINHFQSEVDYGGASDLLIPLPFLLLATIALRDRQAGHGPAWRRPSPAFERLVRAGSPLMLPATLLVVSGVLVTYRPELAVTGFAAALLGYGLRNVLVQVRSFEEHDQLSELSRTDQLTGLPNRRHFDETLRREWNRAHRAGHGLVVLMIDIDHFKLLNDGLGHQVGDLRLQAVGHALERCVARPEDLVARYGGEEFVAVLPMTPPDAAVRIAERMRGTIAKLQLGTPAPGNVVTVSIGLGWAERIDREDADDLVATADAALYDAKRAGRNCVRTRQSDAPLFLAAG